MKTWLGWVALGSLLAVSGCASLRGRADDAFRNGDYARAAELYEQAAAKDHDDDEARAGLARSRERMLDDFVARGEKARAGGRTGEALGFVEAALRKRSSWRYTPPSGLQGRLDGLVAWAREAVEADVVRFVEAGTPLLAEKALAIKDALLVHGELGDVRGPLETRIKAAGAARCKALTAEAGEGRPYLRQLVAVYCGHFGAESPPSAPLPHTVSRLELTGAVAGQSDGERAQLAAKLEEGLRKSVWFDERSPQIWSATLSGSQSVAFRKEAVAIDKPWTERIPYTAYESVMVPYQEPYMYPEYWPASIPYTTFQTRTYRCGDRMCTDTMPVTRYRTEMRTRLVTRYRTQFRSETRPVTRYREEARNFVLHATAHTGTYATDWTVHVWVGPGLSPMVLRRDVRDTQKGLEHDVTFPQAGVSPSRPNLPSAAAWFDRQLAELARTESTAAAEHYRLLFCRRESFDAESAARCVRAPSSSYAEAVRGPLGAFFGPEIDAVLELPR